jgi:hypothetical protein
VSALHSRINPRLVIAWLALSLALLLLASCAPAMPPTQPEIPAETAAPAVEEPETSAPRPTQVLQPTPLPTPFIESRIVELEWPARLRLGDSDVLRLSLIPSQDGYQAQAEFDDHQVQTRQVPLKHRQGYSLIGIAQLDGIGFDISPAGVQPRMVPPGETVSWRWSLAARQPGQQRLTVSLTLRWEPEPGVTGPVSESLAFDRGLDVSVDSILGMTRAQALGAGVFSLLLGGILGAAALAGQFLQPRGGVRTATPNRTLQVERIASITVSPEETGLLQGLFARYSRLVLENEFKSGYSGARAFLVQPVRPDGRADASAIAKIGPRADILDEYHNYEQFVKDRLPPMTARIQRPPVALRGGRLAALQYTFIAEPGRSPLSLRQALLAEANPEYLQRLFEAFGPNWWMQRQPYTFLWQQEYDRFLPPHWVLEPAPGERPQRSLGERGPFDLKSGEIVRLETFHRRRPRADGASWSLHSASQNGQPSCRLRWLSAQPPLSGTVGRVMAGRSDLLRQWTSGVDLHGLPDPLEKLPAWLNSSVQGSRAVIHGDLNLENILVGPGSLVWLIDFAQTREGHSLLDFAHLGSEIVAHILSSRCGSPESFLSCLEAGDPLLLALEEIAGRCLFDPAHPQEFYLALALACLGAMKYPNLPAFGRGCLYLAAAFQAQRLENS